MKTVTTLGSLERDYNNQFGPAAYAKYLLDFEGKTNRERREFLASRVVSKGLTVNP